MPFTLPLARTRTIRVLIFIAAFFAIASFFLRQIDTDDLPRRVATVADIVVGLFDVNAERSAPTWFSALLLFMCVLPLSVIAYFKHRNAEPYRRQWTLLTLLFTVMSLDEIAGIHEHFNAPLLNLLKPVSWLHFAWVVVGMGVVMTLMVVFFRFWQHLETTTRRRFLVAVIIFVTGAIGFEMIGAHEYSRHGPTTLYSFITSIEEFGEMLGATLFLNTFWLILAQMTPTLSVRL